VKLNFEPTVQDNGLIRLAVNPEVSQLDQTNAIKVNGVQVPGLITRRADTTVEIKDGDSLAIGGLFLHDYSNDIRQVPLLGSIPVLGTLFRSARWKRDETELVIIVTPRIVTATDFDKAAKTASISGAEPAVFQFLVTGVISHDQPMSRDPDLLAPINQPATPLQLRGEIKPVTPAPPSAPAVPASGK
jgi:pilus assembly protein CpaC